MCGVLIGRGRLRSKNIVSDAQVSPAGRTNVREIVIETNGLRLVPPLGNLLLLRHVYSACVVTIMLSSITCMVYGGGYEACHQDLYDPTGEQGLDEFDGFDC